MRFELKLNLISQTTSKINNKLFFTQTDMKLQQKKYIKLTSQKF